tara:strand:- start:7219 stop:7887 length:669 start_codon:yes stop_codon:yes gene_type:complete
MRNFYKDTFHHADANKPVATLEAYKGKPRQSYYYLPILPQFQCAAFNSGTKEQKIEAINKYIRSITSQFGRLSHNIKANDKEKESFYRPHYNYNIAQRNLAYQCKSAIEYGKSVENIKYTAPKPDPEPVETKPNKVETENTKPAKENESKPLPPPPMGGGGSGGAFTPPSFCDVNPDSPDCKGNGQETTNSSSERKSKPKKNNILLLLGVAAIGYYVFVINK